MPCDSCILAWPLSKVNKTLLTQPLRHRKLCVSAHFFERRCHMAPTNDDEVVIFRRYRTLPNGKVLDAHHYGLRAWPIRVSGKRNEK